MWWYFWLLAVAALKKVMDDESGASDGEDDYQDSDEDPDYVAEEKNTKPGKNKVYYFCSQKFRFKKHKVNVQ